MKVLHHSIVISLLLAPVYCFSPQASHRSAVSSRSSSLHASTTETASSNTQISDGSEQHPDAVRSPLRFLGPYPTMPLRFPNLATSSQRERNITGVSLDWVLDTAANVNTINAQVAQELGLEKVGEAPGGVGAAGGITGGDTFMLGDCLIDIPRASKDDDEEEDDTFTFMQQLTASALPVASPAAAGLLGLAFFYCFEGGVEFQWGLQEGQIPSVTFYGSKHGLDVDELDKVSYEQLPVSMLPSVTLMINGEAIPALFDTGSPITVLNARAAEAAGIETTIPIEETNPDESDSADGGWNPFSKIASNIQSAQKIAKATTEGNILQIMGTDGKPVRLVKSKEAETVNIKTASSGEKLLSSSQIFVGDIPGLQALGGLGGDAPPAAVLGMDVLSKLPRMVFRARQNEIYL